MAERQIYLENKRDKEDGKKECDRLVGEQCRKGIARNRNNLPSVISQGEMRPFLKMKWERERVSVRFLVLL